MSALPWEDEASLAERIERGRREGRWVLALPMTKPLSMNDASPISKRARMGRNAAIQQVREAVAWLCYEQRIPACKRVRVTLIYEPPGRNRLDRRMKPRRDAINLAATLKPCQDGVVDAGVVPDDTGTYLESPMPLIDLPRDSQHGALQLVIERLA